MNNTEFNMPAISTKYIIRKTGEEVEVIDAEIKERGARTDEDWVTYIDSEGKEHIKEHLNIQLDFKPVVNNIFNNILNSNFNKNIPSTENTIAFEVAKEYLIKFNCSVATAVSIGKQLAHELKED